MGVMSQVSRLPFMPSTVAGGIQKVSPQCEFLLRRVRRGRSCERAGGREGSRM